MSEHIFRNANIYGIEPFKEFIRRSLPGAFHTNGEEGEKKRTGGIVAIDLDQALRRYGELYELDATGDLMLVTAKEMTGTQGGGEIRIYNWLDHAIRTGEYASRWRGKHLLHIRYTESWDFCKYCEQAIRNDADKAFSMFMTADLQWDRRAISCDELVTLLVGA